MTGQRGLAIVTDEVVKAALDEFGRGYGKPADERMRTTLQAALSELETVLTQRTKAMFENNINYCQGQVERYKQFAAEVHREAGAGVSLAAHITSRTRGWTPARRALADQIITWVHEWSDRVAAASEGPDQ